MNESKQEISTQARNRWVAVCIMLLPLMVVIGATLLWLAVQQGRIDIVGALGTSNHGVLISPVREFDSIELLNSDGEPFIYADQQPMWTLVVTGGATCGKDCTQALWLGRQVRTALGRRASYLHRFYVTDGWPLDPEFTDYLHAEQEGLTVLHGRAEPLRDLFTIDYGDGAPPSAYLVDKRGYLMMYYTAENSGKEIMADLKFLMKQSGDE